MTHSAAKPTMTAGAVPQHASEKDGLMRRQGYRSGIRRGYLFSTIAIVLVGVLAVGVAPVQATETVVQNDSIPSPGSGTPLATFIPNEIAATWLTAPTAGDIVGVQILWDSLFGSNPASQELGIHIYSSGTFPVPGSNLATIVGPVLNDGVINEFRFLDPPTNSVPLSVPVTAGQTFVVGLEFLNQNFGNPSASSIEIDSDGCQVGLNSVYASPGTWGDACTLGVTGDFGIRAIIKPVPEPATMVLLLGGALLLPRVVRRGLTA